MNKFTKPIGYFMLLVSLLYLAWVALRLPVVAIASEKGSLVANERLVAETADLELISQIGGRMQAIAVEGRYAYIGVGSRLLVVDIKNTHSPRIIGQTGLLNELQPVQSVALSNGFAYIAAGDVYIISITDPTSPTVVGSYETPGEATELVVQGNYLYLADGTAGLHVLDLSNPVVPTETGVYLPDSGARALAVTIDDNTVYVGFSFSWGGYLAIVDITNPTQPIELSRAGDGGIEKVAVSDQMVYAAYSNYDDIGVYIIDVSQPLNPSIVNSFAGWTVDIVVQANIVYTLNSSGLTLWDVSNPTDVAVIGGYAEQALTYEYDDDVYRAFAFVDGLAFTVGDGLRIVDLTETTPHLLGYHETQQPVYGVDVVGNLAYITINTVLRILDISDPAQMTIVGQFFTAARAESVVVDGNYAYIANTGEGVLILDVSDPALPVFVGKLGLTGVAWEIELAGNYAYVAAGSGGLRVLDVMDPTNPVEVGHLDTALEVHDIALSGNYALLAADDLIVIDVSNPQMPMEVGQASGYGDFFKVTAGADMAFVMNQFASLQSFDITDPANPVSVAYLGLPDEVYAVPDMVLQDRYLYVGGRAFDIRDPYKPVLVTENDLWLDYFPYDVAVAGDKVLVTTVKQDESGLVVLDGSRRSEFVSELDPPGPRRAQLVGVTPSVDMAFVVTGESDGSPTPGFHVIQLGNKLRPVDMVEGTFPGMPIMHSVTAVSDAVYLTEEQNNSSDESGLLLYDLENLAGPMEIDNILGGTTPQDMVVEDNLAYVTSYDMDYPYGGRLSILDIADPYHPAEIGHVEGITVAEHLAVADGFAYVQNSLYDQLQVVDMTTPENPVLAGTVSTPLSDIAASNQYVYVATYGNGVIILDMSDPYQPVSVGSYALPGSTHQVVVLENLLYAVSDDLYILDITEPVTPQLVVTYDLPSESGRDISVAGNYLFLASEMAGMVVFWYPVPVIRTVPIEGSNLEIPYDQTSYLFASDSFTDTVVFTHTAVYPDDAPSTGDLVGVWHFFENTAVLANTGASTQSTQPYTLTIQYSDSDRQIAIEDSLALYYWNGMNWVAEPTSILDTVTNTLTATPTQFGLWAVLGQTNRSFLPLVDRDWLPRN